MTDSIKIEVRLTTQYFETRLLYELGITWADFQSCGKVSLYMMNNGMAINSPTDFII